VTLCNRPFAQLLLPAPRHGGFAQPGYWIWCGSVIRGEDGRYHMFASRWPQSLPFFDGYKQASEVVRAAADQPEGPYTFEEIVLPARGPQHWDGMMTHNPTVHRAGGTFLLFYIGSTYRTPDQSYNNIRIGLATAPSIYGPWTRRSAPVLHPRPGKWDSTVVTNPAPCVLADGRILLVYRSNTPDGLRLGAAMAADADAPFERLADEPVIKFPDGHHAEDPFIWQCGDHFEMLAKDWTGMTGQPGSGLHARSTNMIAWELMPQPRAYSRQVTWDDGATTEQGHLERPQLLIQDGRPTHLFLATGDGPPGGEAMVKTLMSRTWNMVIPLARDGSR
jgi:hypothetical protein